MALMTFPSGKSYEVPEEDIARAEQEYGAFVDTGSPVLAYQFPSGRTHLLNRSDIPKAVREYGATQVRGPYIDVEMPDTTVKQVAQGDLATAVSGGAKAIKPSTLVSDIDASRPADTTPILWYGRKLNTPIEQLDGGSHYLKMAERNARGQAGFFEGLTPGAEDIPLFVGAAVTAAGLVAINNIASKLDREEELTDQELLDLNNFLLEQDREANSSVGGKIGSIIRQSLSFSVDLAATALTLGVGATAIAARGGAKGAAVLAEKALARRAQKLIVDGVTRAVTKSLGQKLVTNVAKTGGKQLAAHYAGRTLGYAAAASVVGAAHTAVKQSVENIAAISAGAEGLTSAAAERRQIYSKLSGRPESEIKSYIMGSIENWVEASSEYTGEMLAGTGRAALRLLPEKWASIVGAKLTGLSAEALKRGEGLLARSLEKTKLTAGATYVAQKLWKSKAVKPENAALFFRNFGYDDVVAEWGEERVAGFLNGLFGTQGDSAGLRNAWEQMWPTTEDGIAEIIAFALPGLYVDGLRGLETFTTGKIYGVAQAGAQILGTITPKVEAKPSETTAGKTTFEGRVLDTKEESEALSKTTDLLRTLATTSDTFSNKAVNLLFDIITLPFSHDLGRIQYGSVDRYLLANNQDALVKQYQVLKDNLGSDESASKAMNALLRYRVRRTVTPATDEALQKRLEKYAEDGVLTREEVGVVATVTEALARDEQAIKHLAEQGVRFIISPSTLKQNIDSSMYEMDEEAFFQSISKEADPGERLAAAIRVGFGRSGGTAQLPILSKGVLRYLDVKLKVLHSLRNRANRNKLDVGSRVTDAEGTVYFVGGITDGVASLVSDDGLQRKIEISVNSVGHPGNKTSGTKYELKQKHMFPVSRLVIEGTQEEFEKARDLFRYGEDVRRYTSPTGKMRGDKPILFTSRGAFNKKGDVYFDPLVGPWSALEDYIESVLPWDIKSIPEAASFLDSLRKYLSSRISNKAASDEERAALSELLTALDSGAERELFGKIIGQKAAGYTLSDGYGSIELLPYRSGIDYLPKELDFYKGRLSGAVAIISRYMGDGAWVAENRNPYLGAGVESEKTVDKDKLRSVKRPGGGEVQRKQGAVEVVSGAPGKESITPSKVPEKKPAVPPAQRKLSDSERAAFIKMLQVQREVQLGRLEKSLAGDNVIARDEKLELIKKELDRRLAEAAAKSAKKAAAEEAEEKGPPEEKPAKEEKKKQKSKKKAEKKAAKKKKAKERKPKEEKPKPAKKVESREAGNAEAAVASDEPPAQAAGINARLSKFRNGPAGHSLVSDSRARSAAEPLMKSLPDGFGDGPEGRVAMLQAFLDLLDPTPEGLTDEEYIAYVLDQNKVSRSQFDDVMTLVENDPGLHSRILNLKEILANLEEPGTEHTTGTPKPSDPEFLKARADLLSRYADYLRDPQGDLASPARPNTELLTGLVGKNSLDIYSLTLKRKFEGSDITEDPREGGPGDASVDTDESDDEDTTIGRLSDSVFGPARQASEHLNKTGVLSAVIDDIYGTTGRAHGALTEFFKYEGVIDNIFKGTVDDAAYVKWLETEARSELGFWIKSFFKYAYEKHGVPPIMLRGMMEAFRRNHPHPVVARSSVSETTGYVPRLLRQHYKDQSIFELTKSNNADEVNLGYRIRDNVTFVGVPDGDSVPFGSTITYNNHEKMNLADSVLSAPGVPEVATEVVTDETGEQVTITRSLSAAIDLRGRAEPGKAKRVLLRMSAGRPLVTTKNGKRADTKDFTELRARMDELVKSNPDFEYFIVGDAPGPDIDVLRYAAFKGYKVRSVYSTPERAATLNAQSSMREYQRLAENRYNPMGLKEISDIVKQACVDLAEADRMYDGSELIQQRRTITATALEKLSGIPTATWMRLDTVRMLGEVGADPSRAIPGVDLKQDIPKSAKGLGLLAPLLSSGRWLVTYLRGGNQRSALQAKTDLGIRLFFQGPSTLNKNGNYTSFGRSALYYLGLTRGVGYAPLAELGLVRNRVMTSPGFYVENVALRAIRRWQSQYSEEADPRDINSEAKVTYRGRALQFADLPGEARKGLIKRWWYEGRLFLGSFADKSSIYTTKIPPGSAVETYNWYREYYKNAPDEIREKMIEVPELTKEQLAVKTGDLFSVDADFWVPIYLAKVSQLIDGNYAAYKNPDTFLKRRASDITGGLTDFTGVVRVRNGRPIRKLIISDPRIAATLNGMHVYSTKLGADYYKAYGPLFVKDWEEDPDYGRVAYSLKYHYKPVDQKSFDPEYEKHMAMVIDGLTGMDDVLAENLDYLMEALDADIIQFGEENIKVTTNKDDWAKDVFDENGNLVGDVDALLTRLASYVRDLKAEDAFVSTDLSRDLKKLTYGRVAKQPRLNLASFGAAGARIQELMAIETAEALAELDLANDDWVIDHIIMRFRDRNHPQHSLYKMLVEDRVPMSDPRVDAKVSNAKMAYVARKMQVKVAREQRLMVGGMNPHATSYTLLDAGGNITKDVNAATYMQLPEQTYNGKPTVVVDEAALSLGALEVPEVEGAFVRAQTYGDGSWNSSIENVARFTADHAMLYRDMFKVADETIPARDANGVLIYVPFAKDQEGNDLVPFGAPLMKLEDSPTSPGKKRVSAESVDTRKIARVKTEEERKFNRGQTFYLPGSIRRSSRIPADNINASHLVRAWINDLSRANFVGMNQTIVKATGGDFDGDMVLEDLPEGNRFDSSRAGRMNRALFLEAELRSDPATYRAATRSLDEASKKRTGALQEAAARSPEPPLKFNALDTFSRSIDENTAGMRDILGISAKANTVTAMINGIIPTQTSFQVGPKDLVDQLSITVGGKEYQIGRTGAEAAYLSDPGNLDTRLLIQDVTTGLNISVAVDDQKAPALWKARLGKVALPYVIELMRFNMSIIPDASVQGEARVKFIEDAATSLWENIVKDLGNNKTHLGRFVELMTGAERISEFDAWVEVAFEMDATEAQRKERKKLESRMQGRDVPATTRAAYAKLVNAVMSPKTSLAGRYAALKRINSGTFNLGVFNDTVTGSNVPNSLGGYLARYSKVKEILETGTAGALSVRVPGFLSATAETALGSMGMAFSHSPIRPLLPALIQDHVGTVTASVINKMREVFNNLLYAESVARLEGGVLKLQDGKTSMPVTVFGPGGLLSKEALGEENFEFVTKFMVLKRDPKTNAVSLRLADRFSANDVTDAERDKLRDILLGLGDATVADLFRLDAASFDVMTTVRGGSFKDLLSSPANHAVRDQIQLNQERIRLEWSKNQALPKTVSKLFQFGVATDVTPKLFSYRIADSGETAVSTNIRQSYEARFEEPGYFEEDEEFPDEDSGFTGVLKQSTDAKEIGKDELRDAFLNTDIDSNTAAQAFFDPGAKDISPRFTNEPYTPRVPTMTPETRRVQTMLNTATRLTQMDTNKTVMLGIRDESGAVTPASNPEARVRFPVELIKLGAIKVEKRGGSVTNVTADMGSEFPWRPLQRLLRAAVNATGNEEMFDDEYVADALTTALKLLYPVRYSWLARPDMSAASKVQQFKAKYAAPAPAAPAPAAPAPAAPAPAPAKRKIKSLSELELPAAETPGQPEAAAPSEEQELRVALANGTGFRGLTPEQTSRYNTLLSAEEDGTLSESGKKDIASLREKMTKPPEVSASIVLSVESVDADGRVTLGVTTPTLSEKERADWKAYRAGEYEYPDESSVEVARKQGVLYRGLNRATVEKVMRRNPDGSLTLFPQKNMSGQVTSVSTSPYRFVAWDYATRDYARGTSRHVDNSGLVLTIANPDLSKAESENAEEVSFPGEVTIPAGQWQLDLVSEFAISEEGLTVEQELEIQKQKEADEREDTGGFTEAELDAFDNSQALARKLAAKFDTLPPARQAEIAWVPVGRSMFAYYAKAANQLLWQARVFFVSPEARERIQSSFVRYNDEIKLFDHLVKLVKNRGAMQFPGERWALHADSQYATVLNLKKVEKTLDEAEREAYESGDLVPITPDDLADWEEYMAEARMDHGPGDEFLEPRDFAERRMRRVAAASDRVTKVLAAFPDRLKNQGFTRVRFPTGETAARVEGHQAIADQLTELQNEREVALSQADDFFVQVGSVKSGPYKQEEAGRVAVERGGVVVPFRDGIANRTVEAIDAEIQNLKTQGIERLAPIEAFYEKRVASIVNRMGAQPVTDANGNTWREVNLGQPEVSASLVQDVGRTMLAGTLLTAPMGMAARAGVPPSERVSRSWADEFKQRLVKYEGQSLVMYKDVGIPAVGPGYRLFPERKKAFEAATGANFEAVRSGKQSLTQNQYNALLDLASRESINKARKLVPEFDRLPDAAKIALADAAHWNVLGSSFPEAFAAIKAGDYITAAMEFRDSKTYRSGGKNRERIDSIARMIQSAASPSESQGFSLVSEAQSLSQGVSRLIASEVGLRTGMPSNDPARLAMHKLRKELEPLLLGVINADTLALSLDRAARLRRLHPVSARFYGTLDELIRKFKPEPAPVVPEEEDAKDHFAINDPPAYQPAAEVQLEFNAITRALEMPIEPMPPDSAYGNDVNRPDINELNASLLQIPYRMTRWAEDSIANYGIDHAHKAYIDTLTRFSALQERETALYNDDLIALAIDGTGEIRDTDTKKVLEYLTDEERTWLAMHPWMFGAIMDYRLGQEKTARRKMTVLGELMGERRRKIEQIRKNTELTSEQAAAEIAGVEDGTRSALEKHFENITITFGRDVELPESEDGPVENGITVAEFYRRLKASSGWAKLAKSRKEKELDWYEHVKKQYNFYAQMAADYPKIVKFNPAYGIPHVWGSGFVSVVRQRAQDLVSVALGNMKRVLPEDTYVTEAELSHKGPDQSDKPTELQKKILRDLMPRLKELIPQSVLESSTRWDYNDLIISALMQHQVEQAEAFLRKGGPAYNPEDAENRRALATINALNNAMNHYKHKEWSRHELARKLDMSIAEINSEFEVVSRLPSGREIRYSLKPATMDTVRLRRMYQSSLMPVVLNRTLLSHFLSMIDYDGQPFILIEPSELEDVRPLISEKTLEIYVNNWYQVNRPGKKRPAGTTLKDALRQIHKSVDLTKYEVIDSPFTSINKFYAKKGDASRLVKHMVQEEARVVLMGVDLAAWYNGLVQWSKMGSVAWSGFFLVSNIESVIAGTGVFGRNIFWHPIEFIKGVRETANQLRTTEPGSLLKKFKNLCTRCGIEFGREAATDQATSVVERNILSLKEKTRLHLGDKAAHGVEAAAKIVGGTHLSERYFGRAGRHVGLFPALKLWATRRAAEELVRSYDPELTFDELDERGQEYIVRKLAKSINDAYGGQLWADYLWATPRVRQILNGLMFALNWTLSAWNIAGGGALTGQILGNPMSQAEADFVTRNTIAMAVYVLFLIPNLAQFAIWAAFGSPDDDDKPFSFLNEETRKSYIDITPLARVFGYDGDPTGKRRIYLRFGKQAYEVYDGWLTEPGAQAARKLSQPVKMVIEQMTGKSPGSDWNLEFQGQGMKGWLDSADEGLAASFLNSRFGYIVQKFIPMSVAQIIKDPQLGLAPFFAPTSKGTSQGRATADLILLYRSLAEDNNWKEFRKFPEAMANLEGVGQQILDGAARNGYDTQLIKKTAKGVVLADLYKRFAAAMNDLDVDRMDSLADRIIRVGGSLQGLRTSQALKKRAVGKVISAEEIELLASAFESPVMPIERAIEEASPRIKTPKSAKPAPVPGKIQINEGDADLTLTEAQELKRRGDLPSSMSAVEAARRSSFLASLDERELGWLDEEIVAPRTPGAVSPGRLMIDEEDKRQATEKARFLSSLSGKEIRWLNQLIQKR